MSKRNKKDGDSSSHVVDDGTALVLEYLQKQGTPEIIAAEESTATRLQEQIDKLKVSERKTRAELTACYAKPLLSELRDDIEKLREEVASITAQLARVRESNPLNDGSCDVKIERTFGRNTVGKDGVIGSLPRPKTGPETL
ncbi:putative TBP interacting domain protein [Aspergillus candidus]|uniref:Uncharacterized protein n=1 Tax=Aspergillus candidus TaxID=41067 RepID=A0A2I2FFH7_ASPCN|nr:hypothetical protein BDW47DRAFT_124684 [Aspergillus candidus]PLB39374.1 hypothetical protein BDW47DRAFT_124684 [Aspergillus candidus]